MNARRMNKTWLGLTSLLGGLLLALAAPAGAACRDAVVLVHGNSGAPSNWDNTYNELRSRGYASSEIFRPAWGSSSCAGTCNDHNGSEETPVRNALNSALASSCTGKIDVIAHSMGVTLSAQQITKLGISGKVDSFVGVAGAVRGLNSCGVYPWNVPSTTCGYYGLSIGSPLLDSIYGKRFGARMYSIKSYNDQIVCAGGWWNCYVYGTHSSSIWNENASYTYNSYGHFGLQRYTATRQVDLIQ